MPACTVRAGYKPWRMAVWLGHLAHVGFDRLVPGAELFRDVLHGFTGWPGEMALPARSVNTASAAWLHPGMTWNSVGSR